MEIKLRKLKGKDINILSKIVKKINLDIKELTADLGKNKSQAGLVIAVNVFANLHLVTEEINILLADMAGMKKETIEELDLDEYGELIKQLKENKELLSFFK